MTLDIRGSLKNTKINSNYYVVLDELFSNAIDSFLIRKSSVDSTESFSVEIDVDFFPRNLEKTQHDMRITFSDNGAGLGDDQTKAFVTKDTSYKDDLGIAGIGKCKGSGRIQYLHYFSKIKIDSIYQSESEFKRRFIEIDVNKKEIDKDSFIDLETNANELKTIITLDSIKSEIYEKIFIEKSIEIEFSASAIRNHIVVSFLQRLVTLKEQLGDFLVSINTNSQGKIEKETLTLSDLPDVTNTREVKAFYDNDNATVFELFVISHYQLKKSKFNLGFNSVALCAKSSAVKFITKRYLKTKTIENSLINDSYHIVIIESNYLDSHVNEQRDDFELPATKDASYSIFNELLSFEQIFDHIDDCIVEMISPPNWSKDGIIKNVKSKYGISLNMILETNVRIHYGDTEETIVKRVLSSYQEKIIKDTSEIFDIKEEISKMEPRSSDFREKMNDLAWKYTSSLKSIDMANLSQVVVRRAAILEVLNLAIGSKLVVQGSNLGVRNENEKIIHNVLFPMQKDSLQIKDHDIWILNEEYHYYDYICSDMPLSKIKLNDEYLFDSDIDDRFREIYENNYMLNSLKRPDIAIFSDEGSVIIIEFKAPGVSLDNHVGDLMEYAQLIAAKSNGKLKKFYGYLIGTEVNPNRLSNYTRFPDGHGWFNTTAIREETSHFPIGQIYSEILYYKDIVGRAQKRLEVYKDRLGLSFD